MKKVNTLKLLIPLRELAYAFSLKTGGSDAIVTMLSNELWYARQIGHSLAMSNVISLDNARTRLNDMCALVELSMNKNTDSSCYCLTKQWPILSVLADALLNKGLNYAKYYNTIDEARIQVMVDGETNVFEFTRRSSKHINLAAGEATTYDEILFYCEIPFSNVKLFLKRVV